jgi:cytochrome c-type biogenesis protein CcmF
LSLLGAFIVRSGVLTSVHAFAVDPLRGGYILAFLLVVIGGSLLLFALRAPLIRSHAKFGGLSREVLLLTNNILLMLSVAVVLCGTLAPLAYEAITGGDKISVGPPYFNKLFVPLMALLSVALGLSSMSRWKRTPLAEISRSIAIYASVSIALGVLAPLLVSGAIHWGVAAALALASWIILTHLVDALRRVRGRMRPPAAYWGSLIAHLGFAIMIIGIAVTSYYSFEKDLAMNAGDRLEVDGIVYEFFGVKPITGPNYVADQGHFGVTEGGAYYELWPEKRRYKANNNVMTEAAIEPGFTRDIYVSLGESLGGGAWAVRVQRKPLVRWVWFGALLMAAGGLLALFDKRYARARARALQPRRASSVAALAASGGVAGG